jgi:hypothetical protein
MMSPLPTFTLEALVTDGRWTAAQNTSRKKAGLKIGEKKTPQSSTRSTKSAKPTL